MKFHEIVVLCVIIYLSGLVLFIQNSKRDIEETLIYQEIKLDSLQRKIKLVKFNSSLENAKLRKRIKEITTRIDTPELHKMLKQVGVTYPWLFLKVAIAECGYDLNSHLARKHNNFFGMMWSSSRYVDYAVPLPDGNIAAGFLTPYSCAWRMYEWENVNPPRKGENPYRWLRRRRYNTVKPNYYYHLEHSIVLK